MNSYEDFEPLVTVRRCNLWFVVNQGIGTFFARYLHRRSWKSNVPRITTCNTSMCDDRTRTRNLVSQKEQVGQYERLALHLSQSRRKTLSSDL
jgi:hypothetical protein